MGKFYQSIQSYGPSFMTKFCSALYHENLLTNIFAKLNLRGGVPCMPAALLFPLEIMLGNILCIELYQILFFSIKIYDKEIMIWQFSYHTPYQPSTSVSALDSHISPRAFGPQADMGVSG